MSHSHDHCGHDHGEHGHGGHDHGGHDHGHGGFGHDGHDHDHDGHDHDHGGHGHGEHGHDHVPPARNPGLAPIDLAPPRGSPWAAFDGASFVDHVCTLLQGNVPLQDAFFCAEYPPDDGEELVHLERSYWCPVDHVRSYITILYMDDNEKARWREFAREDWERIRNNSSAFFEDGRPMPDEPMPQDMFQRLALALHRRIYHHLRLVVWEYANTDRRAAWGLAGIDGDGMRAWDEHAQARFELWNNTYQRSFQLVAQIISRMSYSGPVRRRMAQDVELLDRMAVGLMLMPDFYIAVRLIDHPPPVEFPAEGVGFYSSIAEGALRELMNFLASLHNIVGNHPAPWRRHTLALLRAGRFAPCISLCALIGRFARWEELEARPDLHHERHQLNHRLAMLKDALRIGTRELTDWDKMAKANAKKLDRISDTCDKCGRVPEEGQKFKKCGKCKSAWYCSAECQRDAWKAWHRDVCTEVTAADQGAGPSV